METCGKLVKNEGRRGGGGLLLCPNINMLKRTKMFHHYHQHYFHDMLLSFSKLKNIVQ